LIAAALASEIKASEASAGAIADFRLSVFGKSFHLSPVRFAKAEHEVKRNQTVDDRHLNILSPGGGLGMNGGVSEAARGGV